MIKEDMLVTFGSGRPRAMVTMILNTWKSQGVREDTHARIMFVEPLFGECGRLVKDVGEEMDVPLGALRPLS